MRSFLRIVFALIACSSLAFAQSVSVEQAGLSFGHAWAGGVNGCQFGQIDLNADGKKDLVLFDRYENKLLCFLNLGGYDELNYQFAPQYSILFPDMTDWMILADYDDDGYEDIFTYSKGVAGIRVYRNRGVYPIEFELVADPYLTSLQGGGYVNIFATDADYPAIVDVDGDGDLDIITFGVLGNFIEKHTNLSVELYRTRDSLVFERTDMCWGRVAEDDENNAMYLDTCMFGKNITVSESDFRHRGAALAVRDMNNDGYLDLMVSDVDYDNMIILYGGNNEDGFLFVNQDDGFPTGSPTNQLSMPNIYFGDINNDGLDDMLVSPFNPNVDNVDGSNSIFLYINNGTAELPCFSQVSADFLQCDMIDVGMNSTPVFYDVDKDGLMDIVVGNRGDVVGYQFDQTLTLNRSAGLLYLKNIGTLQSPKFRIESSDYLELFQHNYTFVSPAFCDVDNDGIDELFVGTDTALLSVNSLEVQDYSMCLNISDKHNLAPCFVDVDGDGMNDLILGSRNGKLSYYHGVDDPSRFEFVTDNFGGVNVTDFNTSFYGYSRPSVFELNGQKYLAVGSASGRVFIYQIDGSQLTLTDVSEQFSYLFQYFNSSAQNIKYSSVSIADINGDSIPEMVVGCLGGGLLLSTDATLVESVSEHAFLSFEMSPNPASGAVEIVLEEPDDYRFAIYNLVGEEVMNGCFEGSRTTVNVGTLKTGVYLFSVSADKSTYYQKLMIK